MASFPEFLFAESSRPGLRAPAGARVPAANLKRFQKVQRVTAGEQFGAGGVLDQLQGENRTPPMTHHIVGWIACAQLAVGLLLLWSALGDAPIPAVLKFP